MTSQVLIPLSIVNFRFDRSQNWLGRQLGTLFFGKVLLHSVLLVNSFRSLAEPAVTGSRRSVEFTTVVTRGMSWTSSSKRTSVWLALRSWSSDVKTHTKASRSWSSTVRTSGDLIICFTKASRLYLFLTFTCTLE